MAQNARSLAITAALKRLKDARSALSSQQYSTIKGQIIAGDICGAEKGLRRLSPAMRLYDQRNAQKKGEPT